MSYFLINKIFLFIFFLEFLKSFIINNDFLIKNFNPSLKNSKNKKEIFNWFFNLLFLFLVIFSILLFPILLINNILIIYLFLPILIINIYFIILIKVLSYEKYLLIKCILFFYYLIIFIINSNQTIEININYLLIALINFLEIIIIFFIVKRKISIKLNLNYLNDLRNFYFIKKFVKNLLKSQILKIFIFFLFLLTLNIKI